MYEIKRTEYGLHVTMGGAYAENEIEEYVVEKEKALSEIDGPYSLVVDLRTAIPPEFEDVDLLRESQQKIKDSNLHRMAIIVGSPIIEAQAKQIGFLAGVESKTKYIDASKCDDWEEQVRQWISERITADL